MNRRGFTLIEVMIVIVITGILANIAIIALRGYRVKAEASRVLGDVQVIRVAVMGYYADFNGWPPEAAWSDTPPGLEPYLPVGFSFQRNGSGGPVDYRWRASADSGVAIQIGTLRADPSLVPLIEQGLKRPYTVDGWRLDQIIE